jgi:hypothetical protein
VRGLGRSWMSFPHQSDTEDRAPDQLRPVSAPTSPFPALLTTAVPIAAQERVIHSFAPGADVQSSRVLLGVLRNTLLVPARRLPPGGNRVTPS